MRRRSSGTQTPLRFLRQRMIVASESPPEIGAPTVHRVHSGVGYGDARGQTEVAYTDGQEEEAEKSLVRDVVPLTKSVCEGKAQNWIVLISSFLLRGIHRRTEVGHDHDGGRESLHEGQSVSSEMLPQSARTTTSKLGARSKARLENGLSHCQRHLPSPNIRSAPRSPGCDVSGRKRYMTTNIIMARRANTKCNARQLA